MATLAGVPPQDSRLANANPEYLVGLDKSTKKFYVQAKALECLTSNRGIKSSVLTLWGEPKSGITEVLLGLLNKKARKGSDHPGIYLWDLPLKATDKHGQTNHVYIAEVIGIAQYSPEERQKLLLIAYLISSGMIFCSQGDLGEHNFELWSHLMEGLPRVEVYAANQHLNDMYVASISPNLLWCMTGRRSPLTNSRGAAIQTQSHFEETLKALAEGQAKELRPQVVKFMNTFKNRVCIDASAFHEKELVSSNAVRSTCLPYILKNMSESRPAFANGPQLSNQGLSSLIPSVVESVNGSAPVNLAALFESTYLFELKAAAVSSKLEYVKEVQEIFEARDFDPSQDFVETTLKRLRAKANKSLGEAAQIDEQSTLVSELVKAHLELDEFIEARERAVRRKQETIKTR